MNSYDVYSENRIVGNANVSREGMFYIVRCDIDRISQEICEIWLESKLGKVLCGKCYPDGDRMVLTKRLSVKLWDRDSGRIIVRPIKKAETEPILEDAPFTRLQDLPDAYYIPSEHSIAFRDQSSLTQQDNDQTQECCCESLQN